MKNFQEKEIKDLAVVNGGQDGEAEVRATVNWGGWFDGSFIHGNGINEFDETTVAVKYKF